MVGRASVEVQQLQSRLLLARAELERRLASDKFAGAEELRDTFPDVWSDTDSALELAYAEYVLRAGRGEQPDRDAWYRRFPQWRERLERLFAIYDLSATSADSTEAPAEKTTEAGYELLGEIGRGGMGVVYKARQLALNRVVALKMLRGGILFRPEDADRIRREAEAVARLQHPNIVQVFETGELDGVPFLSLEYVSGGNLEDALVTARRKGANSVTPQTAATLVETLARAVDHAHRHGIIHRDLKPANILLVHKSEIRNLKSEMEASLGSDFGFGISDFQPKIADFGLAAVADAPVGATRTGTIVGTPSYMAPEQATGSRSAIGRATDVYALGGILYRMLAGRPPFEGGTALETLALVLHTEPVRPSQLRPNLPRDLETICLKCLRKEPEKRYASALELADDLARFQRGEPVRARPVSSFERGVKWTRRNPVVAILTVLVAGLVISGAVLLWIRSEERGAASETERQLLQSKYDDAEAARVTEQRQRLELERAFAAERVARARSLWNGYELAEARRVLASVPVELRDDTWQVLHREMIAEIKSSPIPPVAIGRVVPSPDGTRLALLDDGNVVVVIVDSQSQVPIARVELPDYVYKLAFTRDSKQFVFMPKVLDEYYLNQFRTRFKRDPTYRIGTWDWSTNRLASECDVGLNNTSVLSGDGRRIATRVGPRITVRDTTTGKVVGELVEPGTPGRISNLELDRTGKRLAALLHYKLRIWDIATGQVLDTITLKSNSWHGCFSPDGDLIVWVIGIRNQDSPAKELVYHLTGRDLSAGKDLFHMSVPNFAFRRRVVFSPSGRVFAFEESTTIRIHESRTGRHLVTLRGHNSQVCDVAFAPDGKRLYSVGVNFVLKTWNIGPWTK
ncbi:MAG: serine/threonine-protein kinase [Planctomycetia bacterium]|nr:serine/threonine-protein kinase [Planctomycetia bacterium]